MLHWGKASSLGALNNIEGQYETRQSKSFKQHLNLTGILHLLCNENVFFISQAEFILMHMVYRPNFSLDVLNPLVLLCGFSLFCTT